MDYYFKIAETCSIHKIAGYDQFFIVNQNNGCGGVLDKENINFVSMLIGKSVCAVDLCLDKQRLSLLKMLFYQGVLEINNKTYLVEKNIKESEKYLTIVINTTNKCNISCKYCYAYLRQKTYTNYSPKFIIEDIEKLTTDQNNQKIKIVFHGGEPLLCWDSIVEMITKLNSRFKDISYSLQTNGVLINKQIANFALRNKVKIGISLDGFDKRTNSNRFRKKTNYLDVVLNNINLLINNNVNIGLLSVITKDNYKELLQTVIYFTERGVKKFGFNFLLQKGRWNKNHIEIPILELVDIYIKLACFINDYNSQHSQNDYISERTISVLIYSLSHRALGACFSIPCDAGKNLYAIDTNGDVYPCDEFVGDEDFCIGNVNNPEFTIHNVENTHSAKLTHRDSNSIEECRQCQINKLCPFRCPSDAYYRNKNLYHAHSMCEFVKQIQPRYMYLLHNRILNQKYFISLVSLNLC